MMRLPAYKVMTASDARPGHKLEVVGFAGGSLRVQTTAGVISARHPSPHNRIQMDATINPGNSGGPVLDTKKSEYSV